MNKFIFGAAGAALALAVPAAAPAQQLPAATVGVVDVERAGRTCGPCAAAFQQLQAQSQQVEQRAQQLGLARTEQNTLTPLETEEQQIQAAIRAMGGNPDAALQQRIQTFQQRYQQASQEIEGRGATLQRNITFVQQQIAQRLQPAIQQVAQQRGAAVIVDRRNLLFHTPAVDLTDAVLAIVNQNSTAINVNAPPPQQQPAQQPPPQQQQQQQRRPQGR